MSDLYNEISRLVEGYSRELGNGAVISPRLRMIDELRKALVDHSSLGKEQAAKPTMEEVADIIDSYLSAHGNNFFSGALAEEVIETLPGRTETEVKVEGLREAIAAFTPTEGPSDLEGPPLTEEGEALHSMYMAGWRESQETMLYVLGKYADRLGE